MMGNELMPHYTVRVYERDEQGKFWPAGSWTYDRPKQADRQLAYFCSDEGQLCGMVTTPNGIRTYLGMTRDEALRVSSDKRFL
jgi:hypothetical protein